MCNEPSPGGNLICIRNIDSDGMHEGGHIWVFPYVYEIEREEDES